MCGCGGDSAVQSHSVGGVRGRAGTHTHRGTHTHTGTYMRMLHLPFSDLPLGKCPSGLNSVWSFLLTVEIRFGPFGLRWKIGLVFCTYSSTSPEIGFGLFCCLRFLHRK